MVKRVIITVASPTHDGDPGHCQVGFYKVEKGMVVMCDADGRSTGGRLALNGDDPERIARRLLRDRWLKSDQTNFNRPIGAVPRGLA
jgi:hypothetical protein